MNIKTDLIEQDPYQIRRTYKRKHLDSLKASISKYGILNPLIVEKQSDNSYLIVDGERRWRIAKELELSEIPCHIIKRHENNNDRNITRFHIQEQDIRWGKYDEAREVQRLQKKLGITIREIGSLLSMDSSKIRDFIALSEFPVAIQVFAEEQHIPYTWLTEMYPWIFQAAKAIGIPKEKACRNILAKRDGRILTHTVQLRKIKQLFRKDKISQVRKFIMNPSYTIDDAVEESGIKIELITEEAIEQVQKAVTHLRNAGEQEITFTEIEKKILLKYGKEIIRLIKKLK